MSSENLDAGQDSFLDIVANLVGILIILVVLVGAQARSAWSENAESPEETTLVSDMRAEIDESTILAEKLNADHDRMRAQIREELLASGHIQRRRLDLLVEMELARKEIEKRKEDLDAEARVEVERQSVLRELENRAALIEQEKNSVAVDDRPKRETITHYPTPIAKTVFSEEVHFRLKNNRLAFVPLDELMARMKSEWKVKAEKLSQVHSTTETVAEIEGFRLQYELESFKETRKTEFGRVSRDVIQFRQFVILPTRTELGESIGEALQEDSWFFSRLSKKKPAHTTVSIWVYPDSYESFNKAKEWLHQRGYQTAAWPLSNGSLISGSPDGIRSSAQ